ncbi:response regulator [Azotosporobacter soli]|uniref:response regulator n=1 Tax=Azotosporobacter soli TaxID=3055040 RepID=UPI0031FEAFD0
MNNRLLIVDDVLFMRLKLRNTVEQFGYQVVGEAADGKEAIEKYQYLRPDAVLLDITMPEMDGVDCLQYIKKMDPKAKVIMVSAMGQGEFIKQCFKYGAEYFIRKPFDDEKIKKVLNAVVPLPEPEVEIVSESYESQLAALNVKNEEALGTLTIGRKKR